MNLTNQETWNAIYNLASMQGLSTSGLAKRVGVESTLFNKSRKRNNCRISKDTTQRIMQRMGIDEDIFIELAQPKS